MKKLLLFFVFFITFSVQSQIFWTEYATAQPINDTGVSSISIIDTNNTWLNMFWHCGMPPCATTIRQYSKTTNGGTSWITGTIDLGLNSSDLLVGNISGISSTVAYASVYPIASSLGGIWKTADGGTTWTRQNAFNDTNSFADLVHFWNANEGVAVGNSVNGYFEVYTTLNGGNTWTRLMSTPALLPINTSERICVNNFTVTDNTIWVATTSGRILKSSDKGATWVTMQSPIPEIGSGVLFEITQRFGQMAFTDQNGGLFITFERNNASGIRLYKTSDGGGTWSEIMYTGYARSYDISAIPGMPNAYVTVGEEYDGINTGSSFTVDGGLNWVDINSVDELVVQGTIVAMHDADHGFAGGYSTTATEGGIFVWGGGAMLRQAHLNVSTFPGDKAVIASPNPTTGVLHINGKKIQNIEVIDLLGKKIISETYNSLDTVSINLDFLNSGLYMLLVNNDNGSSIIKVVKQ